MKRVHPDEQDNVYPGRRPGPYQPPVLAPAAVGLAHGFDRMQDAGMTVRAAPFPPPPHISGPAGQSQGAQNTGGTAGHPHTPSQSIHVQQPFQGHVQPGSAAQVEGQQHFQRLKVEDALSYLDQVKLQFGSQPQVYNEFLDIMKEFKSQTIDTPGVISRVSALFKGHPDLIVGFNTFLPPGYKIEVNLAEGSTICVQGPGSTIATPIQNLTSTTPVKSSFTSQQQQQQQSQPHSQQTPSQPPASQAQQQQQPHSQQQQQQQQSQQQQPQQPPSTPQQQLVQQSQALPSPGGGQSQTQAQHHAINYVTKIKNRFQGQPEVYQKFLDILNNYQTEQKNIKENAVDSYGRPLTEQEVYVREGKLANEVYQQVAKLFQNQEDLLQEFSQFLPDANGGQISFAQGLSNIREGSNYIPPAKKQAASSSTSKPKQVKKSSTSTPTTPTVTTKPESVVADSAEQTEKTTKKKHHRSALKDVSLAEAVKHGSFSEFAFFDKVRKALKSQEVYENFLRCLVLFNEEVISRPELVQLATTFLGKFPDLFTWFKMFLGYKENQPLDPVSGFKDRGTGGELAHLEIDYASCKRSGASYRALPKSYTQPKSSGRTLLCREVLNDTWVSLPSWSEDTQFPGTRKTQYEEYIYKCEDERFELDVVIETNLSTIKVLEALHKKLLRMPAEEAQKFRLDNSLGGNSEVIYKKAIYRIYGDKAPEIIDGLKKTPHVAVPLVLKRLKSKDEEWRDAQKQFNRIWREQNEKYYLKSLDHQGINFKQTDLKAMRSKSLIHEIEQIFEERNDQLEEGNAEISGPHLSYDYQDKSILDDASSLIVHHMKRQSSIHKDDKLKIKQLLYQFLPDLFFAPRTDLSDDEDKEHTSKPEVFPSSGDADDVYNLFHTNNTWYTFLRLHQMLCERLLKIYYQAMRIAEEEAHDKQHRKEGTAVALRLKQPNAIDVEEYFPAFMEMVKNLLDGNMDSTVFEDTMREMFGVKAYISFTMDRLIQNIVRQLQTIVTEDTCVQLTDLYKQEKLNGATGGPSATITLRSTAEANYQKKSENILSDENCYKIILQKDKSTCKLSMELLPTEDDQSDDAAEDEKWSEYVEKFVGSDEVSSELKENLCKKPIFLVRNARYLKAKAMSRSRRRQKVKLADKDSQESTTENAEKGTSESPKQKQLSHSDIFEDVIEEDHLECKFNVNSYKIVYVSGTEDFMYRKKSLSKAIKMDANQAIPGESPNGIVPISELLEAMANGRVRVIPESTRGVIASFLFDKVIGSMKMCHVTYPDRQMIG